MPTSVALSPQLESFVRAQVDGGRYNNVSEVVRDGLRLLERRQQEDAAKLEALRHAVASGVAAIDGGDFTLLRSGDVKALVTRLGATALASSARRRGSAKGRQA